jgi:rRNA processing protein Krr1/Pno1
VQGRKAVVDKIIAAMEEIVAAKEAQITEIVDVPTRRQGGLIGPGGAAKKTLESQFKVSIYFPSRDSEKTGVKIIGLPADVAKAKAHIQEVTKEEPGETIQVPLHLHHVVSDNGQIFRNLLRDHSVRVDHAGHKVPPKPSRKAAPIGAPLPLITDEQPDADSHTFHTVSVVPAESEGDIPWVLRGDAAGVAKAKAAIAAALEQAQRTTTTGYLVLADPRLYGSVIGQGGKKVQSLRKQTGCTIDVPKIGGQRQAIEISGSEEGVEKARQLILEAVQEGVKRAAGNRRD